MVPSITLAGKNSGHIKCGPVPGHGRRADGARQPAALARAQGHPAQAAAGAHAGPGHHQAGHPQPGPGAPLPPGAHAKLLTAHMMCNIHFFNPLFYPTIYYRY